MRRTSSIAVWISTGVSPASASSRRMRRGSPARTRAISRRLRPGVPRLRAGWSTWPPRPTNSTTSRAFCRASLRLACRRKAPTMTFSMMVISSNVAGTWKVRPIPSRACASGDALVTSTSAKTTRPLVGTRSPTRQLKKVDLPAPFGPIRPMISPSSTASSACDSAMKLPKARETDFASSSMGHGLLARRARGQAAPHFEQTTGLETREDQDDAAIENVGKARAAAAEQAVGRALQRDQYGGAEQRTEQRANAAERRRDDHLDGNQDTEAALGIDEADHQRVERTGERREGRAQHQGVELVAPHRHAEAARGALAGADGTPVIAHAPALEEPGEAEDDGEHGEEDIVIGNGAAEGEVEYRAGYGGPHHADRGAEEIPVADDDADELRHRDRRHREIMALQAEGRHADDDSDENADDHAERHAEDRRQLPLGIKQQRRIGAGAEEDGMADRDLPGIAADDVPCRGGDRSEQQVGAHALIEGAGEDPGIEQQRRRDDDPGPSHSPAAFPISPCGRTHRIRTKSA